MRLPTRTFATSSITITARDEEWPQQTPLGDYYTSILRDPVPYPWAHKPEEPPGTADPSVQPTHRRPRNNPQFKSDQNKASTASQSESTPPEMTIQEKARMIFGTRHYGPEEQAKRVALKESKSTYTAGVLVPPRPEEPDNCCMSGCVNCVWDRFREDMEEWSAKKNEAQEQLRVRSGALGADGGGSGTTRKVPVGNDKIAKDMWDDEVYQSVPVGIREFMKQEKRLKEKHAQEGTIAG